MFIRGTCVSVSVNGLKGFENYQHCELEGYVVGSNTKNKSYVIDLENPISGKFRGTFEQERVSRYRHAEPNKKWSIGDKVQVYELNEGVGGWWDATVIDNGKHPLVQWRGSYEGFPNQCYVMRSNMRSIIN